MTKFIILSCSDVLSLFHDKPVKVYVDHIPHILCTDEYYKNIQDESTDMMDGPEESNYIKDMVEIDNRLEDLSKRVETLEKQMKENREEQLKKLQADLDYAKFCCGLPPTIQRMIGGEE